MLKARIQTIKHYIRARLGEWSQAAGQQYNVVVRGIDQPSIRSAQPDIELTLEITGFDYAEADDTPIEHTSAWLEFNVNILCSAGLQNDDTPIDEICAVVSADIEALILADVYQGTNADTTEGGGAYVNDNLPQGFYGWVFPFKVRTTYPIDQPFTA